MKVWMKLSRKVKVLLVLLMWCQPEQLLAQADNWWEMDMATLNGDQQSLQDLSGEQGLLLLFMDPDCPVTQKYGATIRALYEEYQNKGIRIAAVYPLVLMQQEKIRQFAEAYQYPFPHLLDPKLDLTKAIGASVTPEAFLLSKEGKILYQGAIDNWFYELGRYRRVITRHYLEDALAASLQKQAVPIPKTEAIGCLIGTGMLHHSEH
jgi:peroxiredoxin